ncbi:MAG: hypothetical protein R3F61_11310 [Myxococcota bacterium]
MVLLLLACSGPPTPGSVAPVDTDPPIDTDADTGGPPTPPVDTDDPGPPLSGWDTGEPADCTPIPPNPGPYPSDAPAWRAELDVPAFFPVALLEATYTADGRVLEEIRRTTEGGSTHTTTWVPGTNRPASVSVSGFGPPSTQTWAWNAEVATVTYSGPAVFDTDPDLEVTIRPDGMELERRTLPAGPSGSVSTNTYLGPDTWQLASQTNDQAQNVWTYAWSCLSSTRTFASSATVTRTRHHPDGRVRFGASDFDGDGVDDASTTTRYVADTWRVDYQFGDGAQGPWVIEWTWTAL